MSEAGSAAQTLMLAWDAPRSAPALHATAEALLLACDAALRPARPDWIGHLKALVVTAEGAAYASLTGAGDPITWRGAHAQPAARAELTLYAVVWAADEPLVAAAVSEAVRALLATAGRQTAEIG